MSDGKLPKVGWRKIVKALGKKGFYVTHQRGSHIYSQTNRGNTRSPSRGTIL